MSRQPCTGGHGTWTLHTLLTPSRLSGASLEPAVSHFFTQAEGRAAQAAWKNGHAGNPDAISFVTPWQPGKEGKKSRGRTKPKGRR